jgi:hypothetical protein
MFLDLITPENKKGENISLRPKIWTVIIHLPWLKVILTNLIFCRIYKIAKSGIRFVMSVRRSTWNNSAATGRIYIKLYIWGFFRNLSRKFKFRRNPTRKTGTSHVDVCTSMTISPNYPQNEKCFRKSCRENQNTHFVFNNFFFPKIAPFLRQCGKIWYS